jgi:single-strand DNA-binding protein
MNNKDIDISMNGFVVTEPKFYNSAEKTPFASFRLGHTYSKFDEESKEWKTDSHEWFTVKSFGVLAENISKSIKVGDSITIKGKLTVENYTNPEGKKFETLVINASSIGHNLRMGTTEFEPTYKADIRDKDKQDAQFQQDTLNISQNLETVDDDNYETTEDSLEEKKELAYADAGMPF